MLRGAALGPLGDVDQDRAAVLSFDDARRPTLARELRLEIGHELADVDLELPHRDRTDLAVRLFPFVADRDVVCILHRLRFAPWAQLNRADEIQTEANEVDDVIARERLATKMRVHEAKPAEASLRGAKATDIRQHQLAGVTDDDVVDLSRSMNERAHLASGLDTGGDEGTRELGRRDVRCGNAAPINALERLRRRGR